MGSEKLEMEKWEFCAHLRFFNLRISASINPSIRKLFILHYTLYIIHYQLIFLAATQLNPSIAF